MDKNFEMVAKTMRGLEDVLRDELITLGAQDVEVGLRQVTFRGNQELLYKANLCLRTALRILKPIVKFTASSTDDLYDYVRDLDWKEFLSPDSKFSIDTTVNSADFTHSKYVAYRVKDAIVDHFNDTAGRRPSVSLTNADVILHVHIDGERVTISLDSSGEPLNQRGYRVEQTQAPINEVLAAGIILKTGWRGDSNFLDPMCGSGTFLIEAALIAANINPGIYRSGFAFERWPDFDADLFEQIYNDDSNEREFPFKIYGSDISPEAVAIAAKNIRTARLENMIELSCKPFADWTEVPEAGILITNPPYGERLKPDNIESLWSSIGSQLKKYFPGWHAWILGSKEEQFAQIGLKPSVKFPLLNGSLECSLHEYVLFDGKYSDFKTDGGSVHNDKFNREVRPKVKHVSDEEWKSDARKFNRREERDKADKGRRRDFKRDDRRDDRKRDFRRDDRDFKRDDRKRDFKRDDRDFKRDDRKRDFKRDDRKRDDRDFKRDDRREPRREERRRPNGPKNFLRDGKPFVASNSGPKLPPETEVVFSKYPIRGRRKKSDDNETND